MLELKNKPAEIAEGLVTRSIYLFINARLYILSGEWQWPLFTDELFCSEVIFALGEVNHLPGTRCLLHPDDIHDIQRIIERIHTGKPVKHSFRVITTYGQVITVSGQGYFDYNEQGEFYDTLVSYPFQKYSRDRQFYEQYDQDKLQLKTYQYAERLSANGIWHINTVTHETYYSDEVFRIHGLPPQSLNAHVNTFRSFIHPEDYDAVILALDNAYKEQVPIHIEYRILLNDKTTRHISQTTRWNYNEKAELMISGVVEDITDRILGDQQNEILKHELRLKESLLFHAEGMIPMANWQLNLLTRKIVYSDNVYKIYGLKNISEPVSAHLLMKYVHPEDLEMMQEVNRKILEEQVVPDVRYRIVRPDGKTRYLWQKAKLIAEEGKEIMMVGTIADITEREVTERKLNKIRAEQEIQSLSFSQGEEIAGMGSWVWDLQTGDIQWSKCFYDLLGFKKGKIQLSQKIFLKSIHPDDKELFLEKLNSILNGVAASDFIFRIGRKNETRHLHAFFRLIKLGGRSIFAATFHDKTKEIQLQDKLTDQLKLGEMLEEVSLERVYVTDINNYVIRWNGKCETDYNIKKEAAIGKNLFDIFPQLKTSAVIERFNRVLKGETVYLKDDKDILTGGVNDLLMVPLKDDKGKVWAVLSIINDTTGEFELRQQLTDRLHFIEKLLEASVDRVIVLDRNMNYLYWNKRAEQYYGIGKENIIGKNILEMFPGFIEDPSYSEFRKVFNGETIHIPAIKNLEDKKGYFETYLIPIKDDRTGVTGVLWIVHDLVGEYKLAQQQRKANHILESIKESYVEVDFDGRVIYMNRQAEKFWGINENDVLGSNILELFPQAKDFDTIKALESALVNREDVQGEFYAPLSDKWIYLSLTVTPEGVIILFYDITETKKAAEELLRIKDLLAQKATDKYLTLFNSINQAFCVIEVLFDHHDEPVNYKLLEANPIFEKQTGIKNALGKSVNEFDPQFEKQLVQLYGEITKTGESKHFEYHAQHMTGGLWFEIFAFRFGHPGDRQVAILFNDITERKRREKNFSFMSDLVHDLSTLSTADEIIQTVGNRLGAYLDISNINFLDIDHSKNEELTVSYCWTRPGIPSMLGNFRIDDYLTPEFQRASHAGEIIVINDTRTDNRVTPSVAKNFQVGSIVGMPFHHNGQWKYYLSITDAHPREWRQDEVDLIQDATNRIFPRLERARVEEALKRSEYKYRTLFETMDEGFAICELIRDEMGKAIDFRFLEFNPSLEKHTGLKVDETLGQLASEVAPGLDEWWYHAFQQVADLSESRRIENYVPQLNRWMQVSAYHFDEDQIMLLYDDITERKHAELALKDSEENFRAMFNVTSVGQSQADAATRKILRVNAALCNITGYSEQELQNMTVDQLNHPDDRERDDNIFKQMLDANRGYQIEKRYIRKDGTIVWVNVTGDIIRDDNGQPLRTVAIIQDITERKKTEEHLRKFNELLEKQVSARTKALEESQEWLHSMLEKTSSSIMMLKPVFSAKKQVIDFEYVFLNRQALRSVGKDKLLGKRLCDVFPGVRDTEFFKEYIKVIQTGKDWTGEVHIDFDGMDVLSKVYASRVKNNLLVTYYNMPDGKKAVRNKQSK